MTENDITIMQYDFKPKSRLYYFQGNFYHPLDLPGEWIGKTKKAIRDFIKQNKALVEKDRKDPNYKNLVEIFDEQMRGIN